MNLNDRIASLIELGKKINFDDSDLKYVIGQSNFENKWFTIENCHKTLNAIKTFFLNEEELRKWSSKYDISSTKESKLVALILAGNIPLVGFHDVISCFVSGNISLIKCSHQDRFLIPFLVKKLIAIDSRCSEYFQIVDKLKNFDAVIATGSNNTATQFESYFSKFPHIIRRNRNGVAVLNGDESLDQLIGLSADVFDYFGLGCRNVSKLYLPKDYDLMKILDVFHEQKEIVLHSKYKNNYDYNYAVYLLNSDNFLACGAVILRESEQIASRIACVHYEFYEDKAELVNKLNLHKDEIQCVVGDIEIEGLSTFEFGEAQSPRLWDYADGVDTMNFLLKLEE